MTMTTIEYEKVTGFKDSLTSSIPITETEQIEVKPDNTRLAKTPCKCGETKNLKFVNGVALCRNCRKVTVLDITTRSLIHQGDDLSIELDSEKVLSLYDELKFFILPDHAIVRVSVASSALKNKKTKLKAVELYQKLGLKLTKSEPTLTLI